MKTSDVEVTLIDHCGSDLSVVNAARVSFDKESEWDLKEISGIKGRPDVYGLKEKDVKLIYYLAKHKHLSPFNHAFISLRVKAPIFVARQLVKHEYMPWNEISRRYVDEEPEFYMPSDWRKKADNVKQGSSDEKVLTLLRGFKDVPIGECVDRWTEVSLGAYKELTEAGVCPEQARIVLPHNLMTEWYWSGTLGAFGKMLRLRLDSHTQHETREVAFMVRDIIEPLFPVSLNALLSEYK